VDRHLPCGMVADVVRAFVQSMASQDIPAVLKEKHLAASV